MGYLADCESASSPRAFILEEGRIHLSDAQDNFMFKDAKPFIYRKGSIKRNLHKWKLRIKWIKYA